MIAAIYARKSTEQSGVNDEPEGEEGRLPRSCPHGCGAAVLDVTRGVYEASSRVECPRAARGQGVTVQ
jgi:hypothetical protein